MEPLSREKEELPNNKEAEVIIDNNSYNKDNSNNDFEKFKKGLKRPQNEENIITHQTILMYIKRQN